MDSYPTRLTMFNRKTGPFFENTINKGKLEIASK